MDRVRNSCTAKEKLHFVAYAEAHGRKFSVAESSAFESDVD